MTIPTAEGPSEPLEEMDLSDRANWFTHTDTGCRKASRSARSGTLSGLIVLPPAYNAALDKAVGPIYGTHPNPLAELIPGRRQSKLNGANPEPAGFALEAPTRPPPSSPAPSLSLPTLDLSAYPHLLDAVVRYADDPTLLALRMTCCGIRDRIDTQAPGILRCVVIRPAGAGVSAWTSAGAPLGTFIPEKACAGEEERTASAATAARCQALEPIVVDIDGAWDLYTGRIPRSFSLKPNSIARYVRMRPGCARPKDLQLRARCLVFPPGLGWKRIHVQFPPLVEPGLGTWRAVFHLSRAADFETTLCVQLKQVDTLVLSFSHWRPPTASEAADEAEDPEYHVLQRWKRLVGLICHCAGYNKAAYVVDIDRVDPAWISPEHFYFARDPHHVPKSPRWRPPTPPPPSPVPVVSSFNKFLVSLSLRSPTLPLSPPPRQASTFGPHPIQDVLLESVIAATHVFKHKLVASPNPKRIRYLTADEYRDEIGPGNFDIEYRV